MPTLPTADWLAALADMDHALETALVGVDRYEGRWRAAYTGREVVGTISTADSDPVPERLKQWDTRFAAATELTVAVGRELAERAAVVGRWRESLQRAVQLVEGEPCPASR